jgi:RHS repeat-associated protein
MCAPRLALNVLRSGTSIFWRHFRPAGASNRLQSVSNTSPPRAFTFDASGRTTADGLRTLVHDARGRLAQVTAAVGTTTFAINALGERVAKSGTFTPGGANVFHYDPSGKMVSASVPGIDFWSDVIYLGSTPVAMLVGPAATPTINILQADHLDTVVSILNAAAVQIWRWDRDPYGSVVPNEDPDGDGNPVWFDLRFPGQYHDRETGLVYNYFRDYDPAIGRYVQSDPIGFMLGWLVAVVGISLGNIWLIRHRAEWRADLEGKGSCSADPSRKERSGPE